MGNVKKLHQYLIPLLMLPILGRLAQTLLTPIGASALGSYVVAGDSVVQSLFSILGSALFVLAMTGVSRTAIQAEDGRDDRAKAFHRCVLTVFCGLIVCAAAAFLLAGPLLFRLFISPEEVIQIGVADLRAAAAAMLGMSLIAFLIGQLQQRYSLKTALAFGVLMTVLWTALGYVAALRLGMGITGLGLSRGGVFAATRIAPFLLIPARTFAGEFRPKHTEEDAA